MATFENASIRSNGAGESRVEKIHKGKRDKITQVQLEQAIIRVKLLKVKQVKK